MKRPAAALTAVLLATALFTLSVRAQETSSVDSASMSPPWQTDFARNPLRPADTSSPRATLQSFLDNMNRCHHILMEAQRQNISSPGIFTPDSVKQMAQQAKNLFERGVYCLELGKIPPTLRKAVSYEAALTLKEILDRIDLPPFDLIPDADAIEKEAEEKRFPKLFRWRIPNTDIVIARVEEGPRRGEYLFAAETIDRLDKFWSNIRDLPSRTDAYTSDGFLVFYTSSPGWLLPPKWSQWLPAWSKRMYRSLAVWQWFAYVTVLLLGVLLVIVIYRRLLLRAVSLPPATRS
jgi:MscS family membrane protein